MRILGVDPGTAVLGFGVVDTAPGAAPRLKACGVLTTSAGDPLATRLKELYDGVTALLQHYEPAVVSLEAAFFAKNARTTMVLSHARAVVLLAAAQAGVEIAEYAPAMVKKTVAGRGAALKPQVAYMVQQHLRLASPPEPADAADGVALALTHWLRHRATARVPARATTAAGTTRTVARR